VRVVAVDGSPTGRGRTARAIAAVLAGLPSTVRPESIVSLVDADLDAAVQAVREADAVVIGSPVYRASFAWPLKRFLDLAPRGRFGEAEPILRGTAVAIVATGASSHHFLALDDLRNVLAGFFAAHVVPVGLHVPAEGFTPSGQLQERFRAHAEAQGAALHDLAEAIARSPSLRGIEPQA
jgi:FMN reductase